jgi:hypothetical protein
MLDPFVQIVSDEREKKLTRRTGHGRIGETIAEMYGHSMDTASPRPSMGLWLGRLLIRMGEKLSNQNPSLKSDREKA